MDSRRSSSRRAVRGLLATALALGAVPLVATPSEAGTFAVTSTADNGAGTLREAVMLANGNPGPDQITVPPGTYVLQSQISITDEVTIVGTGGAAVTTVEAAGAHRLFETSNGDLLVLQGLTLTGAQMPGGGGVVMANNAPVTVLDSVLAENDATFGGAIYISNGTLTVQRSTFRQNRSTGPNGGSGGAIGASTAVLTIDQSTFDGNQAVDGNGGAISSVASPATITNTTFTGNSAFGNGGALRVDVPGLVTIRHSTIADNTSPNSSAGIITLSGAEVLLQNTLLWHNTVGATGANCVTNNGGFYTSAGGNLSDDPSCTALTAPTDLLDDDGTTLGALADNGGPTETRLPLAGSTAIDAAPCTAAVVVDQRDVGRPAGASCDIGAVEAPSALPPTSSSTTTSTVAPTTTSTTLPSTTTTGAPTTTSTTTSASRSNVAGQGSVRATVSSPTVATPRFTG